MSKGAIIYLLSDLCINRLFAGLLSVSRELKLVDVIGRRFSKITISGEPIPFGWATQDQIYSCVANVYKVFIRDLEEGELLIAGRGILYEITFREYEYAIKYHELCVRSHIFSSAVHNRCRVDVFVDWEYDEFVNPERIIYPRICS